MEQMNTTNFTKANTDEIDVQIPMLTDEDIDTIVQVIDQKGGKKTEPPNSMASIDDASVSEIEKPEAHAQDPKPAVNQPSGGNTEIGAIQKHVEDSLLFLDNGNVENNVPETVKQNIDHIPSDPINKIVWETVKRTEKVTDIPDIKSDPPVNDPPHEDNSLMEVEQAPNATDTPEQMDQDVESNELIQIAPTQPAIAETLAPVEQVKNPTEVNQKDEYLNDNDISEPKQASSTQDTIQDTVLPVEHLDVTALTGIAVENVDKNIHLQQSSISGTEKENLSPENIKHNAEDAGECALPKNEPGVVVENMDNNVGKSSKSSAEEKEVTPNIISIRAKNLTPEVENSQLLKEPDQASRKLEILMRKTDNGNLPLHAQSQTGIVSKETDKNLDNVELEQQNTSVQEIADENSRSVEDHSKTTAENNDKPTEGQSNTVQKIIQDNLASKNVEEIVVSKNKKSNVTVLTDGPKTEDTIEKNNGNANLESSDISLMEKNIEDRPILSANNDIIVNENMDANVNSNINIESRESHTDSDQGNNNAGMANNENEKDVGKEISQGTKCVWESPAIPDNTRNENEVENMDVNMENITGATHITIKQDNIATNPDNMATVPDKENVNDIVVKQETVAEPKDTDNNIINKEKIADWSQITIKEENMNLNHANTSEIKNTKDSDNHVFKEPSQTTKPLNVWECPIIKQVVESPAHIDENVTNTTDSIHSESTKVLPTRDDVTDFPPAKRAKVEWSIASENTDFNTQTKPSNALKEGSTETSSSGMHTWALNNEFVADIDTDTVPLETSPLWEMPDEAASNRSQSSCSSIPEESMDVEFDLDEFEQNTAADGSITITDSELKWFNSWCAKYGICDLSNPRRRLLAGKKLNKGVIRIVRLPRSHDRAEVLLLLKKYTWQVDKNIWNTVSNVYVNKASSPIYNTAYLKWKSGSKLLVMKAYEILTKEKICLNGEQIGIFYDDRMRVDWSEKEKPFVKKIRPRTLPGITQRSLTPIKPFTNGKIDESDSELFGLSKLFLKDLSITPPLTSEVIVKHVDELVDEHGIRKIFQRAGTIHTISKCPMEYNFKNREFITRNCVQFRIEYDHPLEAVQAISIFHQQVLYDRVLIVTMVKPLPHNAKPMFIIPEGLTSMGPGLGSANRPMLNVRTTVEIGLVKNKYNSEVQRLKTLVNNTLSKATEVLSRQEQLTPQVVASKNTQQNTSEASLKESTSTPQGLQNPENALATLTTVLTNTIQNNILGMLGVQSQQPGMMAPTQLPNWSAPNSELHTWTQPNQPIFSTNIEMQPEQSYLQPVPNIQPNLQPVYMQYPPNVQPGTLQHLPGYGNMQQQPYNIQPLNQPEPSQPNIQPIPVQYIQGSKSNLSNLQTVHPVNPPLPVNPPYGSSQKAVSRFDIPPVVTKPQNQESLKVIKPVPPTEFAHQIPLPVTKPQNRKMISSNLKAVQLVKPKPVGIKFSIPSLQVPKPVPTDVINLDTIPSPAKPLKRTIEATTSKTPPYVPGSAGKAKSPEKEMPWINKQIKAMRRNSKSPEPERSRARSPRYDKPKEGQRGREKDYSREKDFKSRDYSNDREREVERDYKRPATVIFKYLPPSVNSEDLRDKMREIGKLISAQVNGKGHAVVSFRFKNDAATCIEMYNRSKVDGQTIEVKWAK